MNHNYEFGWTSGCSLNSSKQKFHCRVCLNHKLKSLMVSSSSVMSSIKRIKRFLLKSIEPVLNHRDNFSPHTPKHSKNISNCLNLPPSSPWAPWIFFSGQPGVHKWGHDWAQQCLNYLFFLGGSVITTWSPRKSEDSPHFLGISQFQSRQVQKKALNLQKGDASGQHSNIFREWAPLKVPMYQEVSISASSKRCALPS